MENIDKTNEEGLRQTIIVQQAPAPASNGLGTAGFVLALLGLVFCWVPVLGWILWVLGLVFSLCGVFKTPKGLSIAGLVISLIGLIVSIVLIGAAAAAFSSMM